MVCNINRVFLWSWFKIAGRKGDVSISTLNKDQKFAYNLVMNTLSDYFECTDNCENFRMSVAGLA